MIRSSSATSAVAQGMLLLGMLMLSPASAQSPSPSASSAPSKRGISYHNTTSAQDYDILLSTQSPIDWYYTWSPRPGPPSQIFPYGFRASVEFVPTIWGTGNITTDVAALASLPDSCTHLFTFNEPDEPSASGGSMLTPQEAAQAYITHIVPLRKRFNISHPAVTGSTRGLEWLKAFQDACYGIDKQNGCPTDFVVVHWYGGFDGLTGWMGQLRDWYTQAGYVAAAGGNGDSALPFWLGELGIPGAPMDANLAMMRQTLPYLDGLSWVARYAWFGTFRPAEANTWTGSGVAFFDNEGGLTELGSLFLGGKANGFDVGTEGRPPPPPPSSTAGPEPTGGSGSGGNGNGQGNAALEVKAIPKGLMACLCVFLGMTLFGSI